MKIIGRVININKTKQYAFINLISKDKQKIQVVIEKEKLGNIEINDIIKFECIQDIENKKGKSYIVKHFTRIATYNKKNLCTINEKGLEIKSKINFNARKFLNDNQFIEVDIPILCFSENSSMSHSFSSKYNISDDTIYLRKNLDTMLRIISASNIDKIYAIGHCFRNEHITNQREPEFEMLSIYANFYTQQDMIEFTKRFIRNIFEKEIQFQEIDYEEYTKKKRIIEEDFMYIVKDYPIIQGSNAKINKDNNSMEEFKFISKSGTVAHGITEIDKKIEYEELCKKQNLQIFNAENLELYNLFTNGMVPCSSIGISLNRMIVDLCPEIADIKELQIFPFSRAKKYKKHINLEKNENYDILKMYFTDKDIEKIYFKEPSIFYEDVNILRNILEMIENNSKYDSINIKSQIVRQPSKLRELISSYKLINNNSNIETKNKEKEENEK